MYHISIPPLPQQSVPLLGFDTDIEEAFHITHDYENDNVYLEENSEGVGNTLLLKVYINTFTGILFFCIERERREKKKETKAEKEEGGY